MLSQLPSEVIAGDTWTWTRSYGDYPADTWTATVYFENAVGTFSSAAVADGTDHVFTIDAATTAAEAAGRYKWTVRVASGSEAYTVESGWIEVLANPAAAGNRDPRSWARRTLDNLERFLEENALTSQATFTIGGRAVSRWQITELNQWHDKLRAMVRAEEQGATSGNGRNIKVRYRSA